MSVRPLPIDPRAPEGGGQGQRTVRRENVMIGVKLRRRAESWFASRIVEISPGGFRITSFVKLHPGQAIWIMLPGFEGRSATVAWVGDHEAGCAFDRPLHPAIFDHVVRMSGSDRAGG